MPPRKNRTKNRGVRRKTLTRKGRPARAKRIAQRPSKRSICGFIIKRKKRRPISDTRLEKGLRVLNDTNDIKAAARCIRVTLEKFRRAAKRKRAIKKVKGGWKVVARLPRRMPIFTDGKHLAIVVRGKAASQVGRYNAAAENFLRTNNAALLEEFAGQNVKDTSGKTYPFETDPNALYSLSRAGSEPFEDVYRLVL